MPESSSGSAEIPPQFRRTVDMLGAEGFARLQRSLVVVAGLGGVGSHAAVALARSGVGRLRLIDFDPVTWSSLNRHAVALPEDVGTAKVEVVRRHLSRIDPHIDVEAVEAFVDGETAPDLLAGKPDFVLDAIDSLNPKVMFLRACVEGGLPVASSMGASARTDPSQVRVAPLAETTSCPLARQVRKRLRRLGVVEGVTAVYSLEPALPHLPPDEDEERLDRGRVRNRLPSLATMPGIFGYALAGLVIEGVSGWLPDEPP